MRIIKRRSYKKYIVAAVFLIGISSISFKFFDNAEAALGDYTWVELGLNQTSRDVVYSSDGSVLYAISSDSNGYVYSSQNYGITWTQKIGSGPNAWYDISTSANGKYLAGIFTPSSQHYIQTSSDYGATWTEQTSAGLDNWVSVSISSDGSKIFAAPEEGYIQTSSDYGATWTEQTNSGSVAWSSIRLSTNGQTAIGTEYLDSNVLHVSNDGGSSWSGVTMPSTGQWFPASISSDGSKMVAAVRLPLSGSAIYYSDDYGSSWSEISDTIDVAAILISGDGAIISAIDYDSNIHMSQNEGLSFTEYSTGAAYAEEAAAMFLSASSNMDRIVAVAADGNIYTSVDTGQNWRSATTESLPNADSVGSMTISSDGSKIVVCYFAGYVQTSTDYGATWTEQTNSPNGLCTSVESSADGSTIILSQYGGSVFISTDSGATWTEQTDLGTADWVNTAISADGTDMVVSAVGSNYVYVSTDSGATWTEQTDLGTGNWGSVSISADGKMVVVSAIGGSVFISTDSGATWTEQTDLGTGNWVYVGNSADGQVIIAIQGSGYVYVSTDSGATWTEQTDLGTGNWGGGSVSSDGVGIVLWSFDGYIYSSNNSGTTWTEQTNPSTNDSLTVSSTSPDGTIIYMVTANNGLKTMQLDDPNLKVKSGDTGLSVRLNSTDPSNPQTISGNNLIFSGIAYSNGLTNLELHSDPIYCGATADSNGNWTCSLNQVGNGVHAVTVYMSNPNDESIYTSETYYILVSGQEEVVSEPNNQSSEDSVLAVPNTGLNHAKSMMIYYTLGLIGAIMLLVALIYRPKPLR